MAQALNDNTAQYEPEIISIFAEGYMDLTFSIRELVLGKLPITKKNILDICQEAMKFSKQASSETFENKTHFLARIFQNLGKIYLHLNEMDNAKKAFILSKNHFIESLKIETVPEMLRTVLISLHEIFLTVGQMDIKMGQSGKARRSLEKSRLFSHLLLHEDTENLNHDFLDFNTIQKLANIDFDLAEETIFIIYSNTGRALALHLAFVEVYRFIKRNDKMEKVMLIDENADKKSYKLYDDKITNANSALQKFTRACEIAETMGPIDYSFEITMKELECTP